MDSPSEILKKYWGFDSFRPLQERIIGSVLSGTDTLALLPTGGGKSICYQVPALILDGLTLVVSPLIALMQDQVGRLDQIGIPATCLHSGLHYNDVKRVLVDVVNGEYKLLYVSPERLQTNMFKDFLPELNLSLIAVDEAHCISQWGHDFRPAYLGINSLREVYSKVPVLALTATATTDVSSDIVTQLQLKQPRLFRSSFSRKNIFYESRYSEHKRADMLDAIPDDCSIVYCRSRRQTEGIASVLHENGVDAAVYHAGLSKAKRDEAQQLWMNNDAPAMAATTAFGMGIDKADVRMVLHYDAPEHLEAYYQEAGRAGRDGMPSKAIALYNAGDIKRLQESTALHYPSEAYLRQVYQAVADYLQIPISAQPDRYFSFHITEFCERFKLKPTEAIYALKLLEREGLWTLTETVYSPSTVKFTADRHLLDGLQQSHPNLGYVSVGLLRMYNTIFYYPTSVREFAIARQLRMDVAAVEQALHQMHRMELLEYNKPGEGPQMFFHHYRVDSKHLIIDLKRIAQFRKQHEMRTMAMINFLENDTVCRERILLNYFGETPKEDCGHCDVCTYKSRPKVNNTEVRETLWKYICKNEQLPLGVLIKSQPDVAPEILISIIREMIDERNLTIVDGVLCVVK